MILVLHCMDRVLLLNSSRDNVQTATGIFLAL